MVVLTQVRQDSGEVVGRAQGLGVVVAQDSAHAGEGVFAELVEPRSYCPNSRKVAARL